MASPSGPKRQPHGYLVNCPGGHRALVPAPLPPPLAWDQELTINLSSAARAVGRLAGEGRLLITLLLVNRGVLPSPLLYLSAYFEATREDYYARLLGVTEQGEWEEWLTCFRRGVVLQSEDAVDRIQCIEDLFSQWKQDLPRGQSQVPERALDLFAENPFWMVGGLADRRWPSRLPSGP